MKAKIVSIGNSKGIRIPKTILKQCNIKDNVDIEVENKRIILRPITHKPRKGWDKAFKIMHERKDDVLFFDEKIDRDIEDWESK